MFWMKNMKWKVWHLKSSPGFNFGETQKVDVHWIPSTVPIRAVVDSMAVFALWMVTNWGIWKFGKAAFLVTSEWTFPNNFYYIQCNSVYISIFRAASCKTTHNKKNKSCPAFVHTISSGNSVYNIYLTISNTSWSCWNSLSPSGSNHLDKTSLHKMSSPNFSASQCRKLPHLQFLSFFTPSPYSEKTQNMSDSSFSYLF